MSQIKILLDALPKEEKKKAEVLPLQSLSPAREIKINKGSKRKDIYNETAGKEST